MLEGGGKTPILNPLELEDVGYKIVAYPLSLIGVSIQAMQVACLDLFLLNKVHHQEKRSFILTPYTYAAVKDLI